jgi:hypothetical protein
MVANDVAATGEAVGRAGAALLSGGRAQPRIKTAVKKKLGDLIVLI